MEFKNEEKQFLPGEISAMILVKMKETAEAYLGQGFHRRRRHCPGVLQRLPQRQATKDAGVIAGLNITQGSSTNQLPLPLYGF